MDLQRLYNMNWNQFPSSIASEHTKIIIFSRTYINYFSTKLKQYYFKSKCTKAASVAFSKINWNSVTVAKMFYCCIYSNNKCLTYLTYANRSKLTQTLGAHNAPSFDLCSKKFRTQSFFMIYAMLADDDNKLHIRSNISRIINHF